ncbi:MAG TPA: sulfatase [Actinomycetota bacterium]|nr:sulfatase [Actinomycetota bacterium]
MRSERRPRHGHERRRRMAGAVLVLALLSGLLTEVPRGPRAARADDRPLRPNVLIVVTDDQRYDSTGVENHLRRFLGEKGRTFPNAFTTTPTCCPARASIFTGRYVHNHGLRTNDGSTTPNLDHSTTLHAYLQEHGYTTALFGKYLNGWDEFEDPPFFDRYAFFSHNAQGYYFGNTWNVQGKVRFVTRYSTSFIENKVVDFVTSRRARRNPWLSYVWTSAPHAPFTPQRKYLRARVSDFNRTPAMEEEERSDKPDYVQSRDVTHRRVARLRKGQLRTLMSVDDMIANVHRALRRTGQARNTLVIYVSDNGYMYGEHGLQGKTAPYLPSVRIPFLLRFPGRVGGGTVDERLVANIDIAPTVMQAVGLAPPQDPPMDGRSVLNPTWERDRLLLEYFHRARRGTPDWASTITPTEQYTEYYEEGSSEVASFREYYDFIADPYQLENLLGNDDPTDDPLGFPLMSQQLARDRRCVGTEGDNACP